MSDHISFDKLCSFLFAKELTPELRTLATRVNAHILCCPQCDAAFQMLAQVRESVASLRWLADSKLDSAGSANQAPGLLSLFRLEIQHVTQMLTLREALFGDCDFGYPLAVGARDGSNAASARDMLVDNENGLNEIRLTAEGGLYLRLYAQDLPVMEPIAVLLTGEKLVATLPMTRDGETWTAVFAALPSGEYTVVIG